MASAEGGGWLGAIHPALEQFAEKAPPWVPPPSELGWSPPHPNRPILPSAAPQQDSRSPRRAQNHVPPIPDWDNDVWGIPDSGQGPAPRRIPDKLSRPLLTPRRIPLTLGTVR